LKLEIIDPALYVYRFAAHLELDEKANAVSLTALRLVARMKRDWIVAGRRPAGICAAALLIAARAHGFSKHHQDVTKILRVCGMTVTNRVREFELTPAANLTLEQFHRDDIETEADPPAYSRNKIMEARAKAIQEGNTALLTSGALDNPLDGPRKSHLWRAGEKDNKRTAEFKQLYSDLEQQLEVGDETKDTMDGETPVIAAADDGKEKVVQEAEKKPAEEEKQLVVHDPSAKVPEQWKTAYPKAPSGKLLVLSDHATKEEMQESVAPVEAKLSLTEWKESMPDTMDSEFDDIFRTDEEEMQKEAIFNKINKDYLEQQERKETLKKETEAAAVENELDEDEVAQAEGHARYTNKRSKRKRKQQGGTDGDDGEESTIEEQLRAAVSSRKISRKINYDALSSIFDEDGSIGNVEGGGGEDSMYDVL